MTAPSTAQFSIILWVLKLYNINQQTAPLLNKYFNFYDVLCMFQTCLPEDEPSGFKHVEGFVKIKTYV